MKTQLYSTIILAASFAFYNKSNAQANQQLSNLTSPTAVNVNLLPNQDNKRSLGLATRSWKDIYLDGSVYLGGARFLAYQTGTGTFNTALGSAVLNGNTTGSNNTAAGFNSLYSNTNGSSNSAFGIYSLFLNTSGALNSAFGNNALYSNTTGYSNVAIGASAMYHNNSGFNLVAVGDSALFNQADNIYGYYENTAIGSKALYSNTTGWLNTATGYDALYYNTTGISNTAVGERSLFSNTIGSANTALGTEALNYNTTGYRNTATGTFALFDNGTGSDNTATGEDALENNQTGSSNTAVGSLAMSFLTSGYSNVAIGVRALVYSNESNLVAIGDSALYYNGFNAPGGTANVAVGSKALYNNTSGRANSGFGYQTLYSNTTGIHNTGFGYHAGYNVTSGSDNTFIGYNANSGSGGTLVNSTVIGSGATVTVSNNFVFGNSSVVKWGFGKQAASANIIDFANTTAKLTTGGVWTNASDRKLKNNFQKLDRADILDRISKLDIQRWHYIKDSNNITHIGPVAQDFYEAFKVGDDSTISTIDPAGVALLGIQQLAVSDAAKDAKIDALQKEVGELRTIIETLQQNFANCNPCAANSSTLKSTINNQSAMSDELSTMSGASLQQNIPNPFNHTTTINYILPPKYTSAKITITDKNGSLLKQLSISGNGKGSLQVDASTLASGAYQYSLYIDGKLISTKQMEHIN